MNFTFDCSENGSDFLPDAARRDSVDTDLWLRDFASVLQSWKRDSPETGGISKELDTVSMGAGVPADMGDDARDGFFFLGIAQGDDRADRYLARYNQCGTVMIEAGGFSRNAELLAELVGSGNADLGHHADTAGTTLGGVAAEGLGCHAAHLCGTVGRWANYVGRWKRDMAEGTG